ncbi:hypothetical protein RAS1_19890 [Phycisphaerae bacterium RAS1]|nr:hypothetical protein RAS1_19890 [Phycisphaerae bacterium RAS1]
MSATPGTISEQGRACLALALTDGVGPIRFTRLVEKLGSADAVLKAPARELTTVEKVGEETARNIAAGDGLRAAEQEIAAAQQHGVRIISRDDSDYPPGLRQIPDAPIVLFVRGELRQTDAVAVAVVGSRSCTIYGSEQARRFGELLAQGGFTVISGLARGIDAFAHHGAVDAGGRSIAVMGQGLHEIYPPENKALADKLLDHGAWISELPMNALVRANNFPNRNRIIAGMSLGTLVVEAADRSGALITARLAMEYNREVFAVPGRVGDPMSKGTNRLIRDGGAKLVTCLEDVLDGLGEVGERMRPPADSVPSTRAAAAATNTSAAAAPPLTAAESSVYQMLDSEPILQDAVLRSQSFPPGELLAAMTSLELKGLIRRLPGQRVARRAPS